MTFYDIMLVPIKRDFEEYRQKMFAYADAEEKCAERWLDCSVAWQLSSWWWLQVRNYWLKYITVVNNAN